MNFTLGLKSAEARLRVFHDKNHTAIAAIKI